MRFTVQDVLNSRIPPSIGLAPTDSRVIQYLNEATQRLIFEGKWWGLVQRINICASNGCITLPPQIAAIEAVNTCGRPTPLRNMWFEFLPNGLGTRDGQGGSSNGSLWPGCYGMNEAIYRGRFPTFTDIKGTTSKVNLVCDLAADVGNTVLVLGYDQNGNWIRTLQNGVFADGEVVSLAQSGGTTSVNYFTVVTGLQFQSTMNGQSWLYQYDTSTSPVSLTLLGHYQYDETNPSYQRFFFPGILNKQNSSGCTQTKVEILAKLEYIPMKNPTDYLIIGNIPALKEMMGAIKKSENQPDSVAANQIIASGVATAKSILDAELDHESGSGAVLGMTIVGSSVGSNEPIPTFL
jgi:hypothetical protein